MGSAERDPLVENGWQHKNGNTDLQPDKNYTLTEAIQNSYETTDAPKVYKRRWYCLFVYTLLTIAFGIANGTLGNLAHGTRLAFGWTNADIAMASMCPPFMYCITAVFASWLLDVKGPRVAFLSQAVFLAAGTGLRCITSHPPYSNWCIQLGQLLIGVAFSSSLGGASFSNTWFPPHQRTLATSAPLVGTTLGLGLGAILASEMVIIPDKQFHNGSFMANITGHTLANQTGVPEYNLEVRESFMQVMYIEFGLSVVTVLVMLIYFPARPPTPPSLSAASERADFRKGICGLFRNRNFMLLAAWNSLTQGVLSAFGGLLDLNLYAVGVRNDQLVSGYITVGALSSSSIFAVLISSLTDRYPKIRKNCVLLCGVVAFVTMIWFAMIIQGMAARSIATLFVSLIVTQTAGIAPCAPIFELACDATYPIGEAVTVGTLNIISNLVCSAFLLIFLIPNIGTLWMNWVTAAALGACIPILMLVRANDGRDQVDNQQPDKPTPDGGENNIISN